MYFNVLKQICYALIVLIKDWISQNARYNCKKNKIFVISHLIFRRIKKICLRNNPWQLRLANVHREMYLSCINLNRSDAKNNVIICHATFYRHPVGEFACSITTSFTSKAHCVITALSWVSSVCMFGHKIDCIYILLPEQWVSTSEMGTCIVFVACVLEVHLTCNLNYCSITSKE
jgi:hypothetical protein